MFLQSISRKLAAWAVTASLMLSAFTAARADDGDKFTDGNLRFTVISEAEHTAAVSGYVKAPVGELVIPSHAGNGSENYAVTLIAEQAFFNCYEITSVSIPDIITNIGGEAFMFCYSLKSASLSQSIATIPHGLFDGCYSLESVNIPESVTKIENYAFAYCRSLTSIKIPDSVTEIEGLAFGGCESLASIKIPDSVMRIGEGAFGGCSGLTLLELPESNLEIGSEAFNNCTSLVSVDIPETIESIGYGAFSGSGITSLELPAFNRYCLRGGAFSGCPSLESISIAEGESVYQSIDGILYTNEGSLISFPGARKAFTVPEFCNSLELFAFFGCKNLESIEISNTISVIPSYVFLYCEGLKSLIIPTSVVEIREGAFYNCCNLESVEIPNTISVIDRNTFGRCDRLKSIIIPNSVREIDYSAFEFCSSLTTLTLPQSVEVIYEGALMNIESLKKLFILSETPPSLGEKAFSYNYNMSIYIPEGSRDAYESAEEWSKYVNKELSMSIYVETPQLKLTISEKLGVEVGKSDEVTVEIDKADGVEVESERWLSFNPDIATVDEKGVVTGVSEGTALIACTVVDNFGCDHREFCNVTVAPSAGIDSIQAAESDVPAVYYNLNGVRVDGNALAPGFYIKRRGAKAEKILVK